MLAVGDTKTCSGCRAVYSPVATGFARNRLTRDGWQNACKECKRKMHRNWRRGVQSGFIEQMTIAQEGRCAICAKDGVELVLDHCHATEKIRGLLCRMCNALLGMAQDRVEILEEAIAYLKGD